jgi:IclR family KDG regulon transcriptional repressor
MTTEYKRVPAIDKCFAILKLFANTRQHLGISEISKQLDLNKSTVFNIIHTLKDLDVLEQSHDGKFGFGTGLYLLGNANMKRSDLIQTIHPFLDKINRQTKLSAFLGIRSGLQAIIIDKVDTAYDVKISSEIGMQLPLLAGAGGKALLSQLSNEDIDRILSENTLRKFTSKTSIDKNKFKEEVLKTREAGIAFDDGEYIEGVVAFSVPLKTYRQDLQAAIWAVGIKQQISTKTVAENKTFLIQVADDIGQRFLPGAVMQNACEA